MVKGDTGVRVSSQCRIIVTTTPTAMAPKSSVTVTKQTKHNWKNHETIQKRPLDVQEGLKRLFTSLYAQIDGGHFSNAVKTCDKSVFSFR